MRNETIKFGWLTAPALALMLLTAGCKSNPTQAPIQDASTTPAPVDPNADPAASNLCPAGLLSNGQLSSTPSGTAPAQPARVLGARTEAPDYTQQGENYAPQQGTQQGTYQGPDNPNAPEYSGSYQNDVDAGQAAVYAEQAPPPLPVYEQPPAPDPNDEWTPGYWNYGSGGYYWVPGAWVAAPYSGALWTPPYWGFYNHRYGFHRGYWGLHIGFYGGIPYGFGYTGYGYEGGYWRGNDFYYNRSVNRVGSGFRNVYEHNVTVVNNNYNRVSYNGGPGGNVARPRPAEVMAFREQHTPAMATQVAFAHEAAGNRQQFYAANHGQPVLVARQEHVEAVRGIQAPARVNYNQAALAGAQQRNLQEQQRNVQEQQRNQNLQGRNAAEQQRNVQEQQRNQNLQGRNAAEQQRNVQEQQRNQTLVQRNQAQQGVNQQQRQVNEQQHQVNEQQHQANQQQVQRNQQEQQRNVQEQQRNAQEQQRNVQQQQRGVQEQQRNVQQQQRTQQMQQQHQVQQQRTQQVQQQHQVQQQQREVQQARPVVQQPRPEPQQARPEPAPQARPQQAAPQARPQPAPQQHAAPAPAQHEGGGGHPHR